MTEAEKCAMGERGFMKYRRQEAEYRDPRTRVRDFNAVEIPLNEADLRRQAARCMECGTPFCHGHGCPLGNIIPELNLLVHGGWWNEAVDLLRSTNPFPEFTSRVCPAICEASCVLNLNDQPVAIRQIEMAIIEQGFKSGYLAPMPPKTRRSGKLAVIGSGPAGLAVADAVNRAGYGVTVFEKDRRGGGILRYGIPDFKLEKWVLDRRLRLMEAEGIGFKLGVTGGEEVSVDFLRKHFDAICLTGGAREPRDLKTPGRELRGIRFAMEYLVQQNRLLTGEIEKIDPELDAKGKEVVIIGGGDTGADCLGTALRQGASRVLQFEIMSRPPDTRPASTPWPMWPNIRRESSSHKEGGERRWSVNTREFIGRDGAVSGLRGVEVEWAAGPDGRQKFREMPGTEFEVEARLVLLAMGFAGPGRNRMADDLKLELDARGNIRVDDNHMTSHEGIFAAGDMARGQSLVVRAIADGRDAAMGITEYLRHKKTIQNRLG
ncbi:MAG: glutamate synthase subunit beta [Verrucomicrobiae bacterium]|nr:glutamate synthase subunit beta [Verrucomicrobiae bacterium]